MDENTMYHKLKREFRQHLERPLTVQEGAFIRWMARHEQNEHCGHNGSS